MTTGAGSLMARIKGRLMGGVAPEAGFEPTTKRLTATIKRSADSYA